MTDHKDYIVGIGGATMDVHARALSKVRLRDSNPSLIHTSAGGVTRNICENLSRMGMRAVFLSALGNDAFGRSIIESSEGAGMDMSEVYISGTAPTASYIAVLDDEGDMYIGASDLEVLNELPADYFESKRELIKGAKAVITDTNFTVEQLKEIVRVSEGVPIFLDPVSTTKAEKIRDMIGSFYMLKPNLLELEVLSGIHCYCDSDITSACQSLINRGCRMVVVSLGERGCYYQDASGKKLFRKLDAVADMVDATGAGDAFTAGFVNACIKGLPTEDALDYALAAGFIAVESPDTINKNMSDGLVKETAAKHGRKDK